MPRIPRDPKNLHAEPISDSRPDALAALVFLLLLAMPFLCNLNVTYAWSYLKLFVLQTTALLAWCRILLKRLHPAHELRGVSAVVIPMVLLLVWAAMSAMWSAQPWAVLRPLIELAYMAAAAAGLASLFASAEARRPFVLLYGAAATGACIAYVVCYGQAETHMKAYPFENPNVAAAFAIVPMAVGAAYAASAIARKVSPAAGAFGAVVMCLCGTAILVSQSASGLAAGAGAVVMVLVFSLPGRARRSALEVLAVLAILGALWPVLAPELWPCQWDIWLRRQLGIRPALWSGALELARERPLFGFGLGTFFVEYARVHPIGYAAHQYATNTVDKAHCLPLHVAVELGAVGLALSIWLFVRAFRCASRAVHDAKGKDPILLRGLVCGAAGMLAQGLISESIHQPECTVHLVLALALVAGISSGARHQPRTSAPAFKKGWAAALLCTFAAIYMLTAVKPLCGQIHLRRAEHKPRNQWDRRARALNEAIRMSWPWEQLVRSVWPGLWDSLPDVRWPTLWTLQARLKLAQVYADAERHRDALEEAKAVDRLAPNLADVRRMLAALYLQQGQLENATRSIISYCNKDPFDRKAYELWATILHAATERGHPFAAQPQKAIEFLHNAERMSPPRLRATDARALMQPFLDAVKGTTPK